jgi:hypothetical protein
MCANNKLIRLITMPSLLNARKIQLNWTARITLLGPEVLLEWIQKRKKVLYSNALPCFQVSLSLDCFPVP